MHINRWIWLAMVAILLLMLFGALMVATQNTEAPVDARPEPAMLRMEGAPVPEAAGEMEMEMAEDAEAAEEVSDESSAESELPMVGTTTLFDPRTEANSTASAYQRRFWQDGEIESSDRFRTSGGLWTAGDLIALVQPGQWLEVRCDIPSSRVGVHFLGDENDGWARVLVNGQTAWEGNTFGSVGVGFNRYLAITDLPYRIHTIRIEAMGQPASESATESGTENGGTDVTIQEVSCGPTPLDMPIYLPFMSRGEE